MAESRKARARKPPRPLTAASLENAAVYYLSRFASSSGNLRRVLMRKVARAARATLRMRTRRKLPLDEAKRLR